MRARLVAALFALLVFVHSPRVQADTPEATAPKRTGVRVAALSSAALVGLGVFFAFEAQTASAHDVNPTNDEKDRASIDSFATYVSFGLAVVSLIVATVLLLGESSGTKP